MVYIIILIIWHVHMGVSIQFVGERTGAEKADRTIIAAIGAYIHISSSAEPRRRGLAPAHDDWRRHSRITANELERLSRCAVKSTGTCYLWMTAARYGIGKHVIQKIGEQAERPEQRAEEQEVFAVYLAEQAKIAVEVLRTTDLEKHVRILHMSQGLKKTHNILHAR